MELPVLHTVSAVRGSIEARLDTALVTVPIRCVLTVPLEFA